MHASSSAAAAKFDKDHESQPIATQNHSHSTNESKLVPTFRQIFAKGKMQEWGLRYMLDICCMLADILYFENSVKEVRERKGRKQYRDKVKWNLQGSFTNKN